MDQELKTYLDDLKAELKAFVDERCEAVETKLKAVVDDRCEAVETKLLSAFHGWARSMEIRVREERISELERRKAS